MVQVYLPMGYPLQSGNQFENVIYQGSVVRLYTLPKDPRSDTQLQNRRFLSDITKMRSTLGVWGKGVCKLSMGSKWGTVIYQAIKADIGGWWSSALDDWESFSEENQDGWRGNAPYQATFNDNGKIFYALARVIGQSVQEWGEYAWLGVLFGEEDFQAALDWWTDQSASQMFAGTYQDNVIGGNFVGTWTAVAGMGFDGSTITRCANAANQTWTFVYFGKKLTMSARHDSLGGTGNVWVDGVVVGTLNQYMGGDPWFPSGEYKQTRTGLHVMKLERLTARINIDWVAVQ